MEVQKDIQEIRSFLRFFVAASSVALLTAMVTNVQLGRIRTEQSALRELHERGCNASDDQGELKVSDPVPRKVPADELANSTNRVAARPGFDVFERDAALPYPAPRFSKSHIEASK